MRFHPRWRELRDHRRRRPPGDSVGGQTTDEGGPPRNVPRCSRDENYGPGEPYEVHTCRAENAVLDWEMGDPTPSASYNCVCSGRGTQVGQAENCEQALASVCDVDLAAPVPCAGGEGGQAACWPVINQPQSWRCSCTADGPLSRVEADTCQEARVSQCGPDPVYVCQGWGGDAAAPLGGGCMLSTEAP